jgi:hypothetical protein
LHAAKAAGHGDQQCGQYGDAKHTWHLARRYHHFSLPQSSSASRFTAGASGFFILSQSVGILSGLNEKELKNIL